MPVVIELISTASLVGLALWLQLALRVRPELAPFTACSFVVLALYLVGLIGSLAPATQVLYMCGIALGVAAAWRLKSSPSPNRRSIIIAASAFAAMAIAARWWLHGLPYSSWDEFSHWGRVSRTIISTGALPGQSSAVFFKDYPPASALFHYFVLRSAFSEGGTYFAQAIVLLSAALALAQWRGVREGPFYILVLAAAMLLVGILGQGFETVQVDHLLGAVFGVALGAYTIGGSRDLRTCAALIVVLFCIPLLKPIGYVFALWVAGVIVVDGLIGSVADHRQEYPRSSSRLAARAIVWLSLVLAPIAAHQTWNMRLAHLDIQKTFDVQVTRDQIESLAIRSRRTAVQTRIVTNYRRALAVAVVGRYGDGYLTGTGTWTGATVELLPPHSAVQWFLVLTALSALTFFLQPRGARRTHAIVHVSLMVGCVGYLALLLYVYAYGFLEYEGTRILSFGRYAGSWFLGWALCVLAALGNSCKGTRRQRAAGLLVLSIVTGWAYHQVAAQNVQPASGGVEDRRESQTLAQLVTPLMPKHARTYVVWQRSTGYEFQLIAYELIPRATNFWCWTLGKKYYEGDVWTCPFSPADFAMTLASYDFLLIGFADEKFWRTYQGLFVTAGSALPRNRLFAVDHSTSPVTLRPVPGS